ncbi:glycosyltransferase [Fictibacillus sp. UD]|uniref:glycosyltransferase n=1 Tax=Fictibacillus sp. UD TaxID=3038777 RepID=UPI00374565A3
MLISHKSIDVVTVTYGERWELLEKVIKRVITFEEVNSIIIIDNASTYSIEEKLAEQNLSEKVIVMNQKVNLGSALGYKKGIQRAELEKGKFIWLLDDDNLPDENAVQNIIIAQKNSKDKEKTVYSSFRNDREELIRNKGQKLIKNTFFEFSIFEKMKKKKIVQSKIDSKILSCDYVPYGGLIFPKAAIPEVGYPDEMFFLYVDDFDFTYRLTRKGYKIKCVTDSIIEDLERSWFRVEKEPLFKSFFKADDSYRGLMHIRNRVYFEKENNNTNVFIYNLNLVVYLTFVLLKYMPKNATGIKKYKLILKAINLGKKGKLGNEI